jgi:hypothetical protein
MARPRKAEKVAQPVRIRTATACLVVDLFHPAVTPIGMHRSLTPALTTLMHTTPSVPIRGVTLPALRRHLTHRLT